jgi:hypothetical protein
MRLGQVVEHYGEPQYLQADAKTNDQAIVILVYRDVPMLVYAFSEGITNGEITADSEIIGTVFMAPSEMTAFLAETELFVWDGYGSLSTLLTGEASIPEPLSETDVDESNP